MAQGKIFPHGKIKRRRKSLGKEKGKKEKKKGKEKPGLKKKKKTILSRKQENPW